MAHLCACRCGGPGGVEFDDSHLPAARQGITEVCFTRFSYIACSTIEPVVHFFVWSADIVQHWMGSGQHLCDLWRGEACTAWGQWRTQACVSVSQATRGYCGSGHETWLSDVCW